MGIAPTATRPELTALLPRPWAAATDGMLPVASTCQILVYEMRSPSARPSTVPMLASSSARDTNGSQQTLENREFGLERRLS